MEIYDAKVNHLKNPLGFRMPKTVFSWKVKNAGGKKQSAARIKIAASKNDLQNDKNLITDTGFKADLNSLGTEISLDLKPRTRYYWLVSVKDDTSAEAESEPQWFETSKIDEPWAAEWISCDSAENRHPIFEKQIDVKGNIASARLYICGLGLYEGFIDGKRIGGEYLTPYSNDYNEWVQYQTYDVSDMLKENSVISVILGNGWYKGRFGFLSSPDSNKGFYGDSWKLIAELRITFEDGSEKTIGTDESWTVKRSNIIFSNIYDGEQLDDTLPELPATSAVICEPPKGELTARMSLPVTIHETFSPIELIETPKGEKVFDMGQEFTGIFKLHINEPKGTRIHIQTGEVLQNGCFYNENLRSAKSEYIYISDGKEKDIIPHFTFYGYRYVKIEGVSQLEKEDFIGLALYSDIEQKGSLVTGSNLVNRFISNVRWGMKGNFVDVPTDCPQRDERMGWTGDTQVFSPTASYLADTYAFYSKYLYDMAKEQAPLNGKVPDVIPSCGVDSTAAVWGDASCIIPWNLYLFYGDKSILEAQFDSMRSWVDYIRSVDGDNHGWRYVFHYGDWLALDNPNGGADQVLGGTDEEFIANVYYAASADIVAKAAKVLGKEKEAEEYEKLSKEQFDIVKKEYYSPTGRCCIKTQTALLLTLKYNLSDNRELTLKQLKKLFEDNNDKLKTGFVGTPIMCNVLSDNGLSDLAYKLLLNEEYPGWLHEVKLGATTVWERWNSLDENGMISSTGMNSLNHYSYGSVTEWIFRHAAGLEQKECGFKKARIAPELNYKIGGVAAEYDSPAGLYKSAWKTTDGKTVELQFEVPFDCEADIILPYADESAFSDKSNPLLKNMTDGICHVAAGKYAVSYTITQSLKPVYSVHTSRISELQADSELKKAIKEIVDLDRTPAQYRNETIVEMNEHFGKRISPDTMNKIEKILADF